MLECPPIPASLDDVDAEWLTRALAIKYPGTVVTSAIPGNSVRATGTKLRLLLEYNDAGHAHRLPPTMWFKSGLEPHSDHVRTSHAREGLFYSEIQPLGLLNAPACYFSGIDDRGFAAQLIEDLLARNARFGIATRPVSPDVAAQTLTMLARLHAYWWRSPELDRLGPPGGTLETDGIVLRILTNEAWDAAMRRPESAALPQALRSAAAVRTGMEALWSYDRNSTALCMVHGDAHPGNMFFEQDGKPGFLDYQRLMQCDWAHDVNYFMVASMTVEDAVSCERDLLAHYLRELRGLGVPELAFDAAWDSYRRHTMYGLVWNVVPPVMQTPEVCATVAARFNAAAARHGLGSDLP